VGKRKGVCTIVVSTYCRCRYEQSFEEVMEFEDANPDNIKNVEKYVFSIDSFVAILNTYICSGCCYSMLYGT